MHDGYDGMTQVDIEEDKLKDKLFQAAIDYKLSIFNKDFSEKNGGSEKLLFEILKATEELENWYTANQQEII